MFREPKESEAQEAEEGQEKGGGAFLVEQLV